MSLSIAVLLLIAEVTVALVVVVLTKTPALRARNLIFILGVYTGLSFLWAFGLMGELEASEAAGIPANTLIASALFVFNAFVFVTIHSKRERIKYGSAPSE